MGTTASWNPRTPAATRDSDALDSTAADLPLATSIVSVLSPQARTVPFAASESTTVVVTQTQMTTVQRPPPPAATGSGGPTVKLERRRCHVRWAASRRHLSRCQCHRNVDSDVPVPVAALACTMTRIMPVMLRAGSESASGKAMVAGFAPCPDCTCAPLALALAGAVSAGRAMGDGASRPVL